ncbi:MAG: hypothetical protein WBG30_09800 [Psychrilyobacter sp.]|uniref:hypothetical protein n=1 Tax=Psychrilyobacter sp. TaxID=2586924 RepID=UPI003C7865EA
MSLFNKINIEKYDFFKEIKNQIKDLKGMIIPKPYTEKQIIKGLGKRRGKEPLIYKIPSRTVKNKYYEKGINCDEFNFSFSLLKQKKYFDRKTFNTELPYCSKEGGCNFTTIGGLFELLGVAEYRENKYVFIDKKNDLGECFI